MERLYFTQYMSINYEENQRILARKSNAGKIDKFTLKAIIRRSRLLWRVLCKYEDYFFCLEAIKPV